MSTVELILPAYHEAQGLIAQDAARFKVIMSGRRFGKSLLCFSEIAEPAIDGYPTALFSPNYKYASDGWRWFKEHLGPIIASKNEQDMRLELIGGGSIDVWSLEKEDAGRGRKYKRVGIDEAGLVRKLYHIWTSAIRPTLTDFRGDAIIEGTPKGGGDFANMFEKGQKGDDGWKSWRFTTVDNPYMDGSEVASARAELPEAVFKQEYEGIPDDAGGNPFGMAAIAACIGPRSTKPTACFGIDLAKSVDWTVVIGFDAEGRWTEFHRFQKSWGETVDTLREIIGTTKALVDSTGVGDPITEELQRTLPRVEGFKFNSTSKQDLMRRLQSAIQRGTITIPDGEVAAELRTFGYEYRANGVRYEAPSGYHDDCVCSLALANWALGEMPRMVSKVEVVRRVSDNPWLAGHQKSGSPLMGREANA